MRNSALRVSVSCSTKTSLCLWLAAYTACREVQLERLAARVPLSPDDGSNLQSKSG